VVMNEVVRQMAKEHKIMVVWSAEDVSAVRPDLTEEQCWNVLQAASRDHDGEYGINWKVLEVNADYMYPL
jgi:hypothetical protein